MKLLDILAAFLKEHGCKINQKSNHINFRPPSNKIKDFRLELKKNKILIKRIYLRSKSLKRQTFFIPEINIELSVNIHNPESLNIIRKWFLDL